MTTTEINEAADLRALTDAEATSVAGGLNPQPLPPRYLSLTSLFSRWNIAALNPQPLPPRWLSSFFRF
ncbi:MAG: hypothetical protein AB7O57_22830 [Hyphomicrobiaceae bacterium]